jgi:hypothetical protein
MSFSIKEDNEHLSALEQEKARLTNAVNHLQRSNGWACRLLPATASTRTLNTRLLSYTATYDVATNILQGSIQRRAARSAQRGRT